MLGNEGYDTSLDCRLDGESKAKESKKLRLVHFDRSYAIRKIAHDFSALFDSNLTYAQIQKLLSEAYQHHKQRGVEKSKDGAA
jgi:hypothetical protein